MLHIACFQPNQEIFVICEKQVAVATLQKCSHTIGKARLLVNYSLFFDLYKLTITVFQIQLNYLNIGIFSSYLFDPAG